MHDALYRVMRYNALCILKRYALGAASIPTWPRLTSI